MTVARKLLLPTLALFAIALVALVWYFANNTLASAQAEQTRELERLASGLSAQLAAMEDLAIGMATQTAQSTDVQSALAADDRQLLTQITLPTYQRLNELYDIPVFQFHKPPATLYLRPDQPTLGGEDLSATRPNVLAANIHRRNVSGVELSPEGLLVIGIAPIKSSSDITGFASLGQHLGTVEYGLRADKTLLARLKAQYGADWHILFSTRAIQSARLQPPTTTRPGPLPETLLQATTMTEPVFASPEAYQTALRGEMATSQVSAGGKQLALLSVPLRDFAGDTLGVVDIIIDRTAAANELRNRLLVSLGVGLASLLLGGATLIIITRRILRPVQDLTNATVAIAQGDLTRSLPLARRRIPDEITKLSLSFASMTAQLRTLVERLEVTVAERTRDLERRSLQLEVAADIARQITTLTDPERLLDQSVDLIREQFGFYHAAVFLVDDRREYAVLRAATGVAGQQLIAQGFRLRIGQVGIVGAVTASGEARIALDVGIDAVYFKNPLLPETRSEMALPLRAGEAGRERPMVIGALDVQSKEEAAFDAEDITVLQVIADQLAVAIQNARLIQQLNRTVAELEQASGRFTQQSWRSFLASRQAPIGYRYRATGLRETGLQPIYADRERSEKIGADTTPMEIVPPDALQALQEGQVVVVQQAAEEQGSGEGAGASLAVPIRLREQVIGVVHLRMEADGGHPEKGAGSKIPPETISLVEEAASRLALVLESTRLLSQAQQRAQREQLTAQLTSRMRTSLDIDTVLQTAVRELGERLGLAQVEVHLTGMDKE